MIVSAQARHNHGQHRAPSPWRARWRSNAAVRGWRRISARFGWRAYAIPVLIALTLVLLIGPEWVSRDNSNQRADAASQLGTIHRATAHLAAPETAAPAPATPLAAARTRTSSPVTPCTHNTAAQLVLVRIGSQHAWMCQAGRLVYSIAVTTGATGHDTLLGTWQVQAKESDRWLAGEDYTRFVKFWVPYDGDYGFHDAPWQTVPFGSPQYRSGGSHGCVHLPNTAMEWFYNWIQPGAVVTIAA